MCRASVKKRTRRSTEGHKQAFTPLFESQLPYSQHDRPEAEEMRAKEQATVCIVKVLHKKNEKEMKEGVDTIATGHTRLHSQQRTSSFFYLKPATSFLVSLICRQFKSKCPVHNGRPESFLGTCLFFFSRRARLVTRSMHVFFEHACF